MYICYIILKGMETNKKLSQMTDFELSQLSKESILEKSFTETIDEINIDTEYISDAIKHIIGATVVSILMISLVTFSYLFLLSFLIPIFFVYTLRNIIKHRRFYVSLLYMEHEMYSETGEFNQQVLDSYLEKVDLRIRL
jgi:hypothetical protein